MKELRVLELFCGIGGCAAALETFGSVVRVVAACDVSRLALGIYARNFPRHPLLPRTIESLPAAELEALGADLWWLSPPCQPYTRRGQGRDDEDPRARGLLALIARLAEVRPRYLALENVPRFAASRTRGRLLAALEQGGYAVREQLLCPSRLGLPNRRERYYLLASRAGFATGGGPGDPGDRLPDGPDDSSDGHDGSAAASLSAAPARPSPPLAALLDADPDPGLAVDPGLLRRYEGALDLVSADDPGAVTACFTAAYGRSPVRSGSYLETPGGARRFSPAEVLRLLGFPPTFTLPPTLPLEKAWRLAGNSLSLPPVRALLAQLPELATAPTPGPADGGRGSLC
jgi:DNA (cytosine-5)-methyltransferase 1